MARVPSDLLDFVESIVESTLIEAAVPDILREFKKLGGDKQYADAVRYASRHLEILGHGTSRAVAEIDSDTVLKFAIAKSGFAQNSVEASRELQSKYGDIVARVYDRAPDNFWIEVERVTPISSFDGANKWAEALGASNYALMRNYVWEHVELYQQQDDDEEYIEMLRSALEDDPHSQGRKSIADIEDEIDNRFLAYTRLSKNPLVRKLIEFIIEYDITLGDLLPSGSQSKFDSMGFTADGRPVIVDYGMTPEVWDLHYQLPKEEEPTEKRPHKSQVPVQNI